ncbi:hypothetical protein H0H93_005205 [Arthromyces matolae]|nr:hypothetical protein H0H93_005205 [Arthromyces matolae]
MPEDFQGLKDWIMSFVNVNTANMPVEKVSAGSDGTDYFLPVPGAITVGSLNYRDQPSKFSNYGKQVDIWAMGETIIALFTRNMVSLLKEESRARGNGDEVHADGTSLATAQVSGLVALLISVRGNKRPKEMKEMVIQLGMKNKIQRLHKPPYIPYGPNVMAHIPPEIYNERRAP